MSDNYRSRDAWRGGVLERLRGSSLDLAPQPIFCVVRIGVGGAR